MQTQGSLQESDLAALLQAMQSERATGTLTLENGADNCALYFLFGHLFHAAGPGGEGEEVVVQALGWRSGNFRFDPRAKLPAEETIKSSPAELIAGAQAAQPVTAGAWGAAEPERDLATQAIAEQGPTEAETAAWSPAPVPAGSQGQRWSSGEATRDEASTAASWAPAEPGAETPAPMYSTPAYSPSFVQPEEPAPSPASQPVAEAPVPSRQEDAPAGASGAVSAEPVGPLPIPSGRAQYEGLKSAFVDFPRLLRTLRGDHQTGYVRLTTGNFNGVLLFLDGDLVEAQAGDGEQSTGEDAFASFRRQMDTGGGLIDVIDLDGDTVSALARLITGRPLFTGLLGRFIDFPALLEYLAEERVDGSVLVLNGSATGVIMLHQGEVLGSYTSAGGPTETNADAVASLAGERPARIEVRGDDSGRRGIDIEAALSRSS